MEEKERLAKVEEKVKINSDKLNDHEQKIEKLSDVYIALTKVNDKVGNVENDVSEMKADIKVIKEKPEKRFENIVDTILKTVVGAIAGAVIALILK